MNTLPVDHAFQITDEASAKVALLELGLLGKLPSNKQVAENAFCVETDHPTHWLIALRIVGHPDPAENGHMVFGWPKSRYSKVSVDDQIRRILLKFDVHYVRGEPQVSPDAN